MVELSKEEWLEKGKELYGEDTEDWKFKCSNCGRIQSGNSIREQMEKGEKSQRWGMLKKGDDFDPATSCFSPSCNWVSNGLFSTGILVIYDSSKPHDANLLKNCTHVFPFADFNWDEVKQR